MSLLPPDVLTSLLAVELGGASLDEVLQRIVRIANEVVEGADEVSLTLVRQDRPWTAAHAGEMALAADELQYGAGYGPCIDAGTSGTVLHVPDMRTETRWPDYAPRAVEAGVLSSMSVPLPLQCEVVGALNCYSRRPAAFTERSEEVARELAAHLAVAVANAVAYTDIAKLASDMQAAMASRAVIEQAKGVIMAQNRCGAEEAFGILRRASQGRNVKLRDLAQQVVEGVGGTTGQPDGPSPPSR
ncbi:GAF and ANTAR domain-containing protein [Vallicoccus soli]|uniref:ANTAR domain-containing protein n=1 Tax=Vallicoccus soli TaxID=2339232 RepID=A0A3A3YU25_9ACTN|nr:GAF and ANTAR domain-containing protein [Vallicoccus soli]RJK94195.1 ANTAR domain-containing protein [Vallicoccus soli]